MVCISYNRYNYNNFPVKVHLHNLVLLKPLGQDVKQVISPHQGKATEGEGTIPQCLNLLIYP